MAPDQTGLALLLLVLFGTAAHKVYGCVCYVGQEPDRATGKRYGWSLAEQRPCECTEFRLGGVNMKPQIKPYEVKIGGGNRVSVNKQGQIQSPDCSEGTTSEGTSRCANNTHRLLKMGTMELQLPMTSPMRLEFTVNIAVSVYFNPNSPGKDEAFYKVGLNANFAQISKLESSPSLANVDYTKGGVKYLGVPVLITYDNGRFEVAVQGVQDSNLTYDVTSPPQPSWFVSFYSTVEVELNFTEPCINDFKPKFTP